MKTKLAALLIATASVAHANLIDLTPGGFSLLNLPPVVVQWEQYIQQHGIFPIAHADITGNTVTWVPGLLGPPNFNVDPMTQNAGVTWNLTNVSGGQFLYLIVGNSNPNIELANLYQVSADEIINGSGTVTIDGATTIAALNFFGRINVPDSGSTALLSALGLAALVAARIALPGMVGKHLSVSRSLRESLPNRRRLGASVERPD